MLQLEEKLGKVVIDFEKALKSTILLIVIDEEPTMLLQASIAGVVVPRDGTIDVYWCRVPLRNIGGTRGKREHVIGYPVAVTKTADDWMLYNAGTRGMSGLGIQ